MPVKSEKQRRAMHAAAAGKSTLGIPRKVGRKYVGMKGKHTKKGKGGKGGKGKKKMGY